MGYLRSSTTRIAVALGCVIIFQSVNSAAATILKINAATWGAPGHVVDVTHVVLRQVKDGGLELDADNHLFGDPSPGVPKELILNYTLNGSSRADSYAEGDHVSINPPPDKPLNSAELTKLHQWLKRGEFPNVVPTRFGMQIHADGRLRTPQTLSLPVRIEAIARTNDTNIRLFFGDKGVVIFNWEQNRSELRYQHPDSGDVLPIPGRGQVSRNGWHHIIWDITVTGSVIRVDDETRAQILGHYVGLSGTAGIGGAGAGSTLDVMQLDFDPLGAQGVNGRGSPAGPEAADLTKLLERALDPRGAPAERMDAVAALGRKTDAADKLVPPLAKLLANEQEPIPLRTAAAHALSNFGQQAVAPLRRCIHTPQDLVRRTVMDSLAGISPGGTDVIAAALTDTDARTRRAALQSIDDVRLPPVPWLAKIEELSKNSDSGIRADAYLAMPRFAQGDVGLEIVDRLIHALSDPGENVRQAAASAFVMLELRAIPNIGDRVPNWLNDPNPLVRLTGVHCASRLQTPQVSNALLRIAQSDTDPKVRWAATDAILALSPGAYPQLRAQQFIKDLTDPQVDDLHREAAIDELIELIPVPPQALPGLAESLKSRSPGVRRAALIALGKLGSAARQTGPAVVRLLTDTDPGVRAAAEKAAALLNVAPLPTTLPANLPENGPTGIGSKAVSPQAGSSAPLDVRALIGQLHAKEPATRQAAARALGKLGASASAAFDPLVATVRDDPPARTAAVEALQWIEQSNAAQAGSRMFVLIDSVPKALDALKNRCPDDRIDAMRYLASYSRQPGTLLLPLQSGLADHDSRVRVLAVNGLRAMGPPAIEAIPAIIPLLDDWSSEAREGAGNALDAIACDDPRVVDAMMAHLSSPFSDVRGLAAWSLQHAGAASSAALPALRKLAGDDPDPQVRQNAAAAVEAIQKAKQAAANGSAAPSVTTLLIQQLNDPSPDKRRQAAEMLGNAASRSRPALRELTRVMRNDLDGETRVTAAWAVAQIDSDPSGGLAILEDGLNVKGGRVAMLAGQFIARLGGRGVAAIPYLNRGWITGRFNLYADSSSILQKIDAAVAADRRYASAERELIGRLIAALKGAPQGRAAAAEELSFWTWRAWNSAAALAAALRDPNPVVRGNAARAIGFIHASAGVVKAALTANLKDPDRLARIEAAWALGKVQKQAPDAIALLVREAQDYTDPGAQIVAVRRLGELGYKAQAALEVLSRIPRLEAPLELRQAVPDACGRINQSIEVHRSHAYSLPKHPGVPEDESGEDRWFYD